MFSGTHQEPATNLEYFTPAGDIPKKVREISNGIATIPRCVSKSEIMSSQSVAQVHQSEDSLSRYLTPPESPLHIVSS